MIPYAPPRPIKSIPVIDLGAAESSAAGAEQQARALQRACLDTGFFYIANHGMPQSLIDRQFEWSKRFFSLPMEKKIALAQKNSYAKRGYEPPLAQVLDDGSPADLKESFRYGPDPGSSHPYALRKLPTYGPSQWPVDYSDMKEQSMEYYNDIAAVGDRVLRLIAKSLELADDFFLPFYRQPMGTVRLLRYPPHPTNGRDNQLGAGAHTDWGGITILAQDDVGGLEVRNVDGEWIEAPPVSGTFVVNLGEMLARWTNDFYKTNMHRVKNNSTARDRYSIATFYDPEYDAKIECLPSCLAAGSTPVYPTCTSGDHILEMHHRTTVTPAAVG